MGNSMGVFLVNGRFLVPIVRLFIMLNPCIMKWLPLSQFRIHGSLQLYDTHWWLLVSQF